MATQSDLPAHVRAIVDEIETEIGEQPGRAEHLIEGAGHAFSEPGILDCLIRATDQYAGKSS